jgi:thymidine kinase
VVREHGRLVVVSGLDMDSDRVIWPTMDPLLNDADVIEKLLATCEYCKRENAACYTYCKVKKTSQVVVGGKDLYAAVCEKCFDEQTKIKNNG